MTRAGGRVHIHRSPEPARAGDGLRQLVRRGETVDIGVPPQKVWLEVGRVKAIAREADRSAFIVTHALADVEGGVIKRPRH